MSIDKPNIIIKKSELDKIQWYVDKCDVEISGLGKLIKQEDGSLLVTSIYLLKQECTSSDTELDDDSIAELLFESREDAGQMLFWWHSHHDMEVFWSSTDFTAIKQLGKKGMIVASVFNKKKEIKTAIYRKGDEYSPDMFIDDIQLKVTTSHTVEQLKVLEAEFKGKVNIPIIDYGHTSIYGKRLGNVAKEPVGLVDQNVYSTDPTKKEKKLWSNLTFKEKVGFNSIYELFWGVSINLLKPTELDKLIDFAAWYKFDLAEAKEDSDSHSIGAY